MTTALFVAGAALGHVGRALQVGRALTDDDTEVVFTHLSPGAGDRYLGPDFQAIPLDKGLRDRTEFADNLEGVFRAVSPDLICFDIPPLPWLTLVRMPAVPTLYLTNYFLTPISNRDTFQMKYFAEQGETWNKRRNARGLEPLADAKSLYMADAVVLCDPVGLIQEADQLRAPFHPVGPISWQPTAELPPELHSDRRAIVASFGSTGAERPAFEDLDTLRTALDCETVVWATTRPPEQHLGPHNEAYQNIPLSPLLARAPLAITQGGAGSTYAALAAGVPVALTPSHMNHAILADDLDRAGVGALVCDLATCPPEEIVERVDRMSAAVERLQLTSRPGKPEVHAADIARSLLGEGESRRADHVAVNVGNHGSWIPGAVNIGSSPRCDIQTNLPTDPFPFTDGSVDSVLIHASAGGSNHRGFLLDEAHRILRDGGVLVFNVVDSTAPAAAMALASDRFETAFVELHIRRRYSRLPGWAQTWCRRHVPDAVKGATLGGIARKDTASTRPSADPDLVRLYAIALDASGVSYPRPALTVSGRPAPPPSRPPRFPR